MKKRSLFNLFIAATIMALVVRLFLLEDYRIASSSMFPNLLTGDLVFVSKSAFNIRFPFSTYEVLKFKRPQRGEVVAFSLPERGLETFVKRVAGLAGDKIEVRSGILYVNGVAATYKAFSATGLDEAISSTLSGNNFFYEELSGVKPHLIHTDKAKGGNYGPVDVPPDHFFVLGDNRLDSVDSRSWGPVPYSCLKGRVSLVWMSVDEKGQLRNHRSGTWVN